MAWVHPSLTIKLLQNKGKMYKQYNLSHKKKLPVCVAKTIRLTFAFVLTALLLLSIISLNSVRLVMIGMRTCVCRRL